MKTLLTLCLSVIALTAFAQNRQVPPPPNAPATAAPQIPGAPPNPAAPIPPPAAGTSPALAPGTSPVGPAGAPPAPGTTVTATLSASPATTASPAPEMKATGMFTGNFLIDNFRKGGPIMWPILIVSIVGLTV